eukprot:1851245-Ditylum_brightwellii.AAC.1
MLTTLAKVLAVMGYEDDKVAVATKAIGLMRRVMMIRRDTLLMNSSLSPDVVYAMEERWGQGYTDRGGIHGGIKE